MNLDAATTFSIALPPYTMSSREVDELGRVAMKYFCPPGLIVTCEAWEIEPEESARRVVLEHRQTLTCGQHFSERVPIASAVILPAETAQVAFLWRTATGEVQASQLLAIKGSRRLLLLHLCVPGNERISLTNKVNAILESVAMVDQPGGDGSGGRPQTSVGAP